MTDIEIELPFPLDSDGFLRRACPTCNREFKWLPAEEDPSGDGPQQYICPYCGTGAPVDEWFTDEQNAYIHDQVFDQALGPAFDDLENSLRNVARSSGGLFQLRAHFERPEKTQAPPVYEPDDMRRVDFECHPLEPLKVDEEWDRPVHCLVCGSFSDGAASRG